MTWKIKRIVEEQDRTGEPITGVAVIVEDSGTRQRRSHMFEPDGWIQEIASSRITHNGGRAEVSLYEEEDYQEVTYKVTLDPETGDIKVVGDHGSRPSVYNAKRAAERRVSCASRNRIVRGATRRYARQMRLAVSKGQMARMLLDPVKLHFGDQWRQMLGKMVGPVMESLWDHVMGDLFYRQGQIRDFKVKSTAETSFDGEGDLIGGYGYKGNRGFDPPEYAEFTAEVVYPNRIQFDGDWMFNHRDLLEAFQGLRTSKGVDAFLADPDALEALGKVMVMVFQDEVITELDAFFSDELQTADILTDEMDWSPSMESWEGNWDIGSISVSFKSHVQGRNIILSGEIGASLDFEITDAVPAAYEPW